MREIKNLEDVLDEQFPKGECKERGNALVLFSMFKITFEKFIKELKEDSFKCQVNANDKVEMGILFREEIDKLASSVFNSSQTEDGYSDSQKIPKPSGARSSANIDSQNQSEDGQIIKLLKERIKSCHKDLMFAKNQKRYRKDWIEGFRSRLDELLLIWHELHNISFIDSCEEFNINYKDVDTEEVKDKKSEPKGDLNVKCDVCGEKHDRKNMMVECADCYVRGWKSEFKKEQFIKDKKGKVEK